jgi:predicted nucleic acid-binding protein
MKSGRAFWDSSSLLPLCCNQKEFTVTSKTLVRRFPKMVVWWSTPVEMENGLQRLIRNRQIDNQEIIVARERLSMLSSHWREILPTEDVRFIAVDVLKQHQLSTADVLQLSAALVWCKRKPNNHVFICSDKNLKNAADVEGFQTLSYP